MENLAFKFTNIIIEVENAQFVKFMELDSESAK